MLVQAKRQNKMRKTNIMSVPLLHIEFINQNKRLDLCIWISNILIRGRMPLTSLTDFSYVPCHLFITFEFAGLPFFAIDNRGGTYSKSHLSFNPSFFNQITQHKWSKCECCMNFAHLWDSKRQPGNWINKCFMLYTFPVSRLLSSTRSFPLILPINFGMCGRSV